MQSIRQIATPLGRELSLEALGWLGGGSLGGPPLGTEDVGNRPQPMGTRFDEAIRRDVDEEPYVDPPYEYPEPNENGGGRDQIWPYRFNDENENWDRGTGQGYNYLANSNESTGGYEDYGSSGYQDYASMGGYEDYGSTSNYQDYASFGGSGYV